MRSSMRAKLIIIDILFQITIAGNKKKPGQVWIPCPVFLKKNI